MKKIALRIATVLSLISILTITVAALTWDGSTTSGNSNAVSGSNTGYVIRSTNDSECVVGYRFSAVNSDGDLKVNKVIDIYRDTTYGNNAYTNSAKFSTKYNKKQLIANKNSRLTTTKNTTNCYKEKDVGFVSKLPNPSGVETWQAYEANINKVLTKIGVGTVSNMIYGDKVIIEPLFDVCLAGEYQALTVSEIAYCGRSVLGGSSKGGASTNSSSWGFIANYTNRIWPNKLYTPNGQSLWTAASAIGSSAKETFENILTKGYGAGIAYNETVRVTYTIAFNGNGSTSGSTSSMSMVYGTAKNLTANGFKKTGYAFNGWNTKSDGSGTSYANKASVKNLTKTNGATVTLYAKWKANSYTISFNGNGSTSGSMSNLAMTYGTAKNLTGNAFSKTGYAFNGWNTKSDGSGTSYANKASVKNLTATSGGTVTLYAKWKANSYSIVFNGNGSTSGSMSNLSMTYGTAKNLTANAFSKTGYTFNGWNTKSDGSGTSYANKASVKNLTATSGGTVTLYAKWKANSYSIVFNGNGSTSGSMSNLSMTYGTAKNLTANAFSKTGYTFNGWNTKSDGTGTNYADKASVKNLTSTSGGTVTLYAKWSTNGYVIAFNGNGSTSGSMLNLAMTYGTAKSLTANAFSKTGYTFNGWNTKADGNGTNYDDKASVKNLTTTNGATVTLYAKWKANTYSIAFNGNGSTSGSMSNLAMTYGTAKNLTANAFSKTGYTFNGWNTKADGNGTNYADRANVNNLTATNNATVTLYARWSPITYTIRFNGNGSTSGRMGDISISYDEIKTLTANAFIKTGYIFKGWNTKSDASGTGFINCQKVKNLATSDQAIITLYAQWDEIETETELLLKAISPNSPYREGTDVISTFQIVNMRSKDILPEDNVRVTFKVYKDNTVIKTATINSVVVPAYETNLIYFKWSVPNGISENHLYISAQITEGDSSYGLIKNEYSVCKYDENVTPDTRFEISVPDDFVMPITPTEESNTATWSIWVYENGLFSRVNYGISISNDSALIIPNATANAKQKDGVWIVKSGYGFGLSLDNGIKNLVGYEVAPIESYTGAQYALALFPEFKYSENVNKCRTLILNSGKWQFRENSSYGQTHFTPLWYPDGEYTVTVVQSDCWTPAGMITRKSNTNTITISGSAYDDWYIGNS